MKEIVIFFSVWFCILKFSFKKFLYIVLSVIFSYKHSIISTGIFSLNCDLFSNAFGNLKKSLKVIFSCIYIMVRDCGVHVTYYLNSVKDFVTWYPVKFVNLPCVTEDSLCFLLLIKFIIIVVLMFYIFTNILSV